MKDLGVLCAAHPGKCCSASWPLAGHAFACWPSHASTLRSTGCCLCLHWPPCLAQDPSKWGGAIELSILSRHLGREIAAFDIQTQRVDIYGQDAGYGERVMVIYDGEPCAARTLAPDGGGAEQGGRGTWGPSAAFQGPHVQLQSLCTCSAGLQSASPAAYTFVQPLSAGRLSVRHPMSLLRPSKAVGIIAPPPGPRIAPAGLHYDALAVAAYEGAPESLDVTVVPASGPRCEAVMAAARSLTAAAQKARAFTDTANFTLRRVTREYPVLRQAAIDKPQARAIRPHASPSWLACSARCSGAHMISSPFLQVWSVPGRAQG